MKDSSRNSQLRQRKLAARLKQQKFDNDRSENAARKKKLLNQPIVM